MNDETRNESPVEQRVVYVDKTAKNDKKGKRTISLILAALGLGTGIFAHEVAKSKGYCTAVSYDRTVETNTVLGDNEPVATPTATVEATPVVIATSVPTVEPTIVPTAVPTTVPTAVPTTVPTVEPTVVPTAVPTTVPTVEPTVVPTAVPTTVSTVAPTEAPVYAFKDPSNELDVEMAVDRIYAVDMNPAIAALNNPAFEAQVTREDIVDLVRILHNELPIYRELNESTYNQLLMKFAQAYGALGMGNDLYNFHFELLCQDGSSLAKYCRSYDEIYERIAEYRKEGNIDGFVEEVGELSKKLRDEWIFFGMNNGWNPYLFTKEERTLAYNAAILRYARFVREYLISNNLTVCVDGCYQVDPVTFELNPTRKQFETRDIVEAMQLENGMSANGEVSIVVGNERYDLGGHMYNDLLQSLLIKAQEAKKVL